jgi:hypothetical protein
MTELRGKELRLKALKDWLRVTKWYGTAKEIANLEARIAKMESE